MAKMTTLEYTQGIHDWVNGRISRTTANLKDIIVDLITTGLGDGTITPYQAEILESWANDYSEVTNQWDETIRTTAGDDPVMTGRGGVVQSIVAASDFKCSGLRTTAYNQLRLKTDGGAAKQIGSAYVIPIPKLELGSFGDAQYNNGMLFTGKPDGYNGGFVLDGIDLQPSVRYVPLSAGEPTSATAGTVIQPTSVIYDDKTYHTYLTSGEGWLIVSGITWADTCAHLAWEDWYSRFISPNDAADTGDVINLAPLFAAAPNGTGKFLALGNIATRADRINATQMLITDPIARITSPSWTTEEAAGGSEDSETTYRHSLVISGMKSNGLAKIEGSDQELIVEGTTVSYIDTEATAISGVVRYERATAATATVTLAKTAYNLDDCGLEIKEDAEGTAFMECSYAQNVADALSQIAKVRLDSSMRVLAEAIAAQQAEIEQLKALLFGKDAATLPIVKALTMEAEELYMYGAPLILKSKVAGAPSAANIPDNWNEEKSNVWNGCPRFVGQRYIDQASKKVYEAVTLTNSTADWVALN